MAIPEGTRLPGVPKNVFNLGSDYRLPIGDTGWTSDWHIDGVFRTNAPGAIPSVYLSGWNIPSSKIIDALVSFDQGRQWSFGVFGTNLTSDPGYSGAVGVQGAPANTLNYRNVTRPRTIGISAKYRFN